MTAAPEAGARAAPCRPDWRRAAALIAQGHTVIDVSRRVGCSRSQLSHKRNHDPRFQDWIEKFRQADMDPHDRLARLRRKVHAKIEEEVGKGTVRVLIWLAERLNLLTPPSEQTPVGELHNILSGLSPEELLEFEALRDAEEAAPAAQEPGDGPQLEPARTTTSRPG